MSLSLPSEVKFHGSISFVMESKFNSIGQSYEKIIEDSQLIIYTLDMIIHVTKKIIPSPWSYRNLLMSPTLAYVCYFIWTNGSITEIVMLIFKLDAIQVRVLRQFRGQEAPG